MDIGELSKLKSELNDADSCDLDWSQIEKLDADETKRRHRKHCGGRRGSRGGSIYSGYPQNLQSHG